MAADGMMGEEVDPRKGSRFSYSPVLQIVGKVGYYDDSARDEEFGLAPFRGQNFAFVATIVVDGGRTYLQIAALATPLLLMTAGSGADGTDAGLPGTQTDAESSAGPDGGIVRNQATFVTVGMQLEWLRPWCTAAAVDDVLANRDDDDFLSGNPLDYGGRLQAQIEQAANFLMDVQGGTRKQVQEHLGPPRDWKVNNDRPDLTLPGHFWMFSSEYGSGGQNSDMELTVSVEMSRRIRVEQNAAAPFLAGRQVVVPFRLRQIGYTLCGDPEAVGDVCSPAATRRGKSWSEAQVRAMVQQASEQSVKQTIQELRNAGMLR